MQVTVSYQEMTCFVELNISTVSNYWTDSWSYTVTVIMKILSNIQFKENSAPSPICWKWFQIISAPEQSLEHSEDLEVIRGNYWSKQK